MSDEATTGTGGERLRELFEQLVDLDAAARRTRVGELDLPAALRARLDALLDAPVDRASLLQIPVVAAIEYLRDDEARVRSLGGSIVGPFRLGELLGEGGSATVFRAERAAGAATQVVALKLLRSGLYSPDGQRRFRREQSILAQLTHPNIARLVEAGISDAGVPYLAMEFVDGVAITLDAEQRGLDLRQRLQRFATLCRAVEAAHAALIVHRDLKPSNVFVTHDGEIKVLDFGIAKLIDPAGDDEGLATRTQSIALTPEYAAPEQFQPGPVTTAADVYALGVLLGELLTGRRLNASATRGASALLAADESYEAPRGLPERRQLARQLRGDLDAVIATAMAEEPERRYRSAGALAADIESHLAGKPVAAHPPTRWYRARKFVARHRCGVAITVLLTLGILVSLVIAALQAHRANREAELARATRDFLVDVFAQVEPAGPRAPPPTVVDVVEAALARIDSETVDERVRLDLRTQLGRVLRSQSRVEQAIAVLERAVADGQAHFDADDPMLFDARRLLGEACIVGGRYEQAAALVRDLGGVAMRQETSRRIDYELMAINLENKQGDAEGALARTERAIATCAQACDARQRLSLATARAVTLTEFGREGEAAAEYERALVLARSVHGRQHVEVASVLNGLSGSYRRLGRLDEAKRSALETIAIDDAVLAPAHWRRSIHWNNLGNVHMVLNEDEAALAAFERAVDISRQVSGDDDPSLAMDLVNIGVLQNRLGRPLEARATLRDAVRHAERGYGESNRRTARIRASEAFNFALTGDIAAALAAMQRALADLRSAGAAARAWLFDALRQQARILLLAHDAAASLAAVKEAEALAAELGYTVPVARLLALEAIRAGALRELGEPDAARRSYQTVLSRRTELGNDDYTVAEVHFGLALLGMPVQCAAAREHLAQGRAALAQRRYVHAYLQAAQHDVEQQLRAPCP